MLLISYLLLLILVIGFGNLLIRFFKIGKFKTYFGLFLSALIGSLFLSIVYSIVKSDGITINWLLLVLTLFFLKYLKKSPHRDESNFNIKQLVLVILISFILFIINYLQLNTQGFIEPNLDLFGYAEHVKTLAVFGKENSLGFVSNLLKTDLGLTPYHYYELWIAAFITNTFGVNSMEAYWVFLYPLLYFISYLGFLSIIEHYKKVNFLDIIISVLCLLIGGVYLNLYGLIPYMEASKYLANNLITGYGPLYPFIILFIYFYMKKEYSLSFIVLMMICVISFSVIPVVIGGLILLIIFNKSFTIKFKLNWIALILILGVIILSFYVLFGEKTGAKVKFSDFIIFHVFNNYSLGESILVLGRKMLVYFLLLPSKVLLTYLPFIMLIYSFKERLSNLKFIVFFLLSGLFSAFLFAFNPEGLWLFRNFCIPLINISIAYVLIKPYVDSRFKLSGKVFLVAVVCAQIFLTYQNSNVEVSPEEKHSTEYLSQISNQFQSKKNVIGGLFLPNSYFDEAFIKNPKTVLPTRYLSGMVQYAGVVNLSTNEIDVDKLVDNRVVENSDFELYKKAFKVIDQRLTLKFIKEHNLKFLVFHKLYQIPTNFENLISKQIVDSKTGERFCILKDL